MRDGVQFLERRSERIGKTPDRSGLEFLVLRLEVEVMHRAGNVLRSFESALDEDAYERLSAQTILTTSL